MTDNMTEKPLNYERLLRQAGLWFLAIAVFLLIDYLSEVLLPFFVAWLFAYLLYPMVSFADRRLHTPRALSILLTLIVVIAVITGVIYLIIPPMFEQFEKLESLVTDYIHKTANIDSIPEAVSRWFNENHHDIEKFFKSKDFTDGLKTIMPGVFTFLGQTYSVIMSIIASFITLLYMFFILLDYEYRLPDGNRSRHHDRHYGSGALPAHFCPHPHGIVSTVEGSGYGAELLDYSAWCPDCVHCRAAYLRYDCHAKSHG